MIGYKLFRLRDDGTIGPLFINRKQVVPLGVWLEAETHHRRSGFAYRPGWHACYRPVAPHLQMELKNGERRVWCRIQMEGVKRYERPESQGGAWVLAERIMVEEILHGECEPAVEGAEGARAGE